MGSSSPRIRGENPKKYLSCHQPEIYVYKITTLSETNSKFAPENGWLENDSFPFGMPFFHGQNVSSGSVAFDNPTLLKRNINYNCKAAIGFWGKIADDDDDDDDDDDGDGGGGVQHFSHPYHYHYLNHSHIIRPISNRQTFASLSI